jgi:hopanoid biosynthesis associated protein HpnK
VNADDFGLTSGVNRAIVEAHRSGIVTSSTLMANAPAFDEAVQIARDSPKLSVGCHIVLINGTPITSPTTIPTLVTGRPARFRESLSSVAFCALSHRLQPSEIEAEVTAQIRKIQAAGITVSHVDTHKHTHIFPAILEPVLRAAAACGVPAIRKPIEARLMPFTLSPRLMKRGLQLQFLRRIAADFALKVKAAGLRTTDGVVGIVATGSLRLELFRGLIASLPDGTWELVCHPGYEDDALRATGTRLLGSRRKELELLTSDAARRILEDQAVELMSFQQLASS